MEPLTIFLNILPHNKTDTKCHSFVDLSNRGRAKIDYVGYMRVIDDVTLDDVLFDPKFKVNLLFISKLTKALNCNGTFYPNFCVVPDLTLKRTIGWGRQNNGLYFLSIIRHLHHANTTNHKSNLWHINLGIHLLFHSNCYPRPIPKFH